MKMKLKVASILVIVVALGALYYIRSQNEWDRFCRIAIRIQSDPHIPANHRGMMVYHEALQSKFWSDRFTSALKAAGMADPKVRYSLMKQASADAGFPNWSCPALEGLFVSM